MAIAENDEALGLYTDSFAAYFSGGPGMVAGERLSGTPIWQVEQLRRPKCCAAGSAGLIQRPAERRHARRPERQVHRPLRLGRSGNSGRVTVSYLISDSLPQGADIPDHVTLTPAQKT